MQKFAAPSTLMETDALTINTDHSVGAGHDCRGEFCAVHLSATGPQRIDDAMLLYDHPLSSYCQKVKIALREKGVAFDAVLPPDLGTGQRDTPFAAANPRVEVPALSVDGSTIFDSTIIMEFVEERWPTPALLPADPLARAFARETEEMCDTHYEAVNWGFAEILWYNRAEGALAQQLKEAAARDTAVLQSWLTDRLGSADWFGGTEFGWADAAAAPMVNRSVYYGFGPTQGSPLFQWHQRLCARPTVAATFSEFDVAAERMASLSDLYTTGGRRREYRDHRLEWMVRSGGISVVTAGLEAGNIRFSWPGAKESRTLLHKPDPTSDAASLNDHRA